VTTEPLVGVRHPWCTDFEWQRAEQPPRRLTNAQVQQFDNDGWLVVDNLLDPSTLRELTAELDEIEAEADAFIRSQPDDRFVISEADAITFSTQAVLTSPAARRASRLNSITDICHDLIGSDVRLYWDQLVYKKPQKPREFPWHQDNGYTFIEPQQYLTIWLALTDATVDNGCPWVAPGAHRTGTLAHSYLHPLGLQCFADHPDATAAPVRAGGAVVFSSLTPHRTGPNTTEAVRKTYILQFAPDGVEVLRGDPGQDSPTSRALQNDPDCQYLVLRDGEQVGSTI
jgi:phytanoyl-CoA hydroxylase